MSGLTRATLSPMTPSRHDPRPPYQQAADTLRNEITSGKLKAGEQLPSHRELQERFNIANMTARSALRVLREEGLIYTVMGRGSYVSDTISTPAEPETDSDSPQAAESITEILRAVRDEVRTLNADVQALKTEVEKLKARDAERNTP